MRSQAIEFCLFRTHDQKGIDAMRRQREMPLAVVVFGIANVLRIWLSAMVIK